MSKIKYVLCPGFVISRRDGDEHYIGATPLADLYNVPMSECVVDSPSVDSSGLIRLAPRYNGNYSLPKGTDK